MVSRLILGVLLILATGSGVPAAAVDGDPDRPVITGRAPNANDSIWMDLGHPAKSEPARRATQLDVNRLKKLNTKPSVKCAIVESVHQCLSSQNMTLARNRCRAGQTEATCCQARRNYVNANICGPIWNRLKRAGKTYYPGIWLCKCVETVRTLKPRRLDRDVLRPR